VKEWRDGFELFQSGTWRAAAVYGVVCTVLGEFKAKANANYSTGMIWAVFP